MASLLLVLTGKTASGKDTITSALLQKFPTLKKVVTTTSRTARASEVGGVDYHFLTRVEFEDKINKGNFAEYVEYGGNLYGTQKTELEKALKRDMLWKIDPSRAGEVRDFIKRSFPNREAEELIKKVVVIYITVADEIVLQRLKNRGLTEEEIKSRMADDDKIWLKYQTSYDYVVENEPGKLETTMQKIYQIIKKHDSQ